MKIYFELFKKISQKDFEVLLCAFDKKLWHALMISSLVIFIKLAVQMFNEEEIFILKELLEIEISEIKGMIKASIGLDKKELQDHLIKVENILKKLE